MKSQDETRQTKTFTRSGDDLSLDGVPLETIEYSFFQGQLLEVQLRWNLEHRDNASATPPSSDVSTYCTSHYGPPTKNIIARNSIEYVWRGQQSRTRHRSSCACRAWHDKVNGGWAIPPETDRPDGHPQPPARLAPRRIGVICEPSEKENGL